VSTIDSGHLVGLTMSKKRRLRRLWEDEEKIQIVAQTRVPGVSVLQVARRYDVNANLVFRWLRDPRFNRLVEDHAAVLFGSGGGRRTANSWFSRHRRANCRCACH